MARKHRGKKGGAGRPVHTARPRLRVLDRTTTDEVRKPRSAVVHLTGPRSIVDAPGRPPTDISLVRLRAAYKISRDHGHNLLLLSYQKNEYDQVLADRRSVEAELGFAPALVKELPGGRHSLDNAWFALKYAHEHGLTELWIVTSGWHVPRVTVVFERLNGYVHRRCRVPLISLKYFAVSSSSNPLVAEYEQRQAAAERRTKIAEQKRRLKDYVRKARKIPGRDFPPRPDDILGPHRPAMPAFANSVVEPDETPPNVVLPQQPPPSTTAFCRLAF